MNRFEIRDATDADAVQLSELIQRTIRVSNSRDYDAEAIGLLCAIFEPKQVAERIDKERMVVCLAGDEPVGVAGLKGEYLRSVFIEPACQRQGLGKMLVAKIEEMAQQDALPELLVHSSVTAQQFYETLGYEFVEFQSYPEGPFVLMKKALD